MSDELSMACFYASIWNLLDMTAGSMPVTIVKQDEQQYNCEYDDMVTKMLK
jgi:hypothetical protein